MGVGLAILLPLALVLTGLPSGSAEWRAAAFAAASGLCEAAALACLLRGLVTGNLSIVTPLASLAGGFVAVIAIIGGESLSTPALIGLPLAVAGGLMVAPSRRAAGRAETTDGRGCTADRRPGKPRCRGTGSRPRSRTCAAAPVPRGRGHGRRRLGLALVRPVRRRRLPAGRGHGPAPGGASPRTAASAPWSCSSRWPCCSPACGCPRRSPGAAPCAGVFDAGRSSRFAAAITIGPLAVASVVIAQGGTMAVLLGYLLLHERLSRLQYVGVACTCVAVTLFAIG